MMSILVFLVVSFGLFGVFITQYISQYREIYLLWLEEIVFKGFYPPCVEDSDHKINQIQCCSKENINICSKVESYSKEICSFADIIRLLFAMICFVSIIAFFVAELSINNPGEKPLYIYYAVEILIFSMLIAIYFLLNEADIDIINPHNTNQIDEKLFDLWCKLSCRSFKVEMYKKELRPIRMYEILSKKIKEYNIKIVDDNILNEIIKENIIRKNKEMNERPESIYELLIEDKNLKKILETGK
ncbi:MAG: hypothetical protein PHV51_01105 [Methanosarcinaceae archaeon]|nr:hypothetical protein [Methanosarcinaceae archaeon]